LLYSGGGEKKRIVIGFREAAMASASPFVELKKRKKERKKEERKRGPDANIYKRKRERREYKEERARVVGGKEKRVVKIKKREKGKE
jgi:hypothetical protein